MNDPANALLEPAMIAYLASAGVERAVEAGEILYGSGESAPDFFVVLDGEVTIVRPGDVEVQIASWGPGGFLGELNLLSGQRTLMTARVTRPGRVLQIPLATFRRLMSERPDFSDIVFRAFLARRSILREGEGAEAIRIVGSRYSPEALALRAFASRSRLPFTWIDLEDVDDPSVLLASVGARASDAPIVLTPTGRFIRPSPGQLAEHLGLTYHGVPGSVCDLVIVGSGPAGLAAAVYGASEGLDTVCLDATAIGGQAGTSSRIENYVGFPNGVSGEDLAARAAAQAFRLGARINAPCRVAALRTEPTFFVVTLEDQSEIPTRAVIIATGAHYRRLDVPNLERFEGAGVYYAATDMEARTCRQQPVVVVGGGNSAGQAAIYLAENSTVKLVIRGDDLGKSMSQYLVDRITVHPRIEVLRNTQVRALDGNAHLEEVTLEHTSDGTRQTEACSGVFCFIGAVPATDWLDGMVALDRDGFVMTDRSLPDRAVTTNRPPLPYETSLPGVFAVGDVRHDSMKRVAAAVGEGSSAVKAVHEYLALHDPAR